jgi:hypothetical protein
VRSSSKLGFCTNALSRDLSPLNYDLRLRIFRGWGSIH